MKSIFSKTHSFALVLPLLAFAVLAGCGQEGIVKEPEPRQAQFSSLQGTTIGEPEGAATRSEQEEMALLRSVTQVGFEMGKAARSAESWQEADRAVRDILRSNSSSPHLYALEQVAASTMLGRWLLDGKMSPERKQAIGFYTERLIENNSPDAALVQRSLEALQGTWSPARIAQAAEQTARLSKKSTAGNDDPSALGEALGSEDFANRQKKDHYRRLQAIDELRTMSKRLKAKAND